MSKDLYKILGISQDAREKDIRSAYRAMARKLHPDAGAGSSEEKFREVQGAYETLIDPAARAAYDRKRPADRPAPESWRPYAVREDPAHIDLSDIFSRTRPEPVRSRHAAEGSGPNAPFDPWTYLEDLLRFFEGFDRDW